jgi:hypothetical protein
MTYMRNIIFSLLCVLASAPATAQTADEIIAKHLAARGGIALDSIKTAEMDIIVSFKNAPQVKSTVTNRIVNMQSHRIDMSVPDLYDVVICFDGNSGWSTVKRGDDTQLTLIDSSEAQELKYQTEIAGPLHRFKEKGYTATYLGLDTLQGSTVHKIRIDAACKTTYFSFIDTTGYSEIKRTTIAPSEGKMQTVDLYYTDIKPVMGVYMPYRIEMHNRRGVTYFDYTRIVLNSDIDPQLFKKPAIPEK